MAKPRLFDEETAAEIKRRLWAGDIPASVVRDLFPHADERLANQLRMCMYSMLSGRTYKDVPPLTPPPRNQTPDPRRLKAPRLSTKQWADLHFCVVERGMTDPEEIAELIRCKKTQVQRLMFAFEGVRLAKAGMTDKEIAEHLDIPISYLPLYRRLVVE